MYTNDVDWHTAHYGAPDRFGYKDFIPMFTVPKFDADAWAGLFHQSGARYVVPVAEHHDGFAMWDSAITPWCAGKMGPRRDLIGELAKSVRKQGMIFGLSNHRMEHHDFAYPAAGVANDQFDPRYAGFYGPPISGGMNEGNASAAFQKDWLARVQEQIDKYQPQMIYFDNGINPREYDEVKLKAAAYYYNRAKEWGMQCTIASKDEAYLFGTVKDFEKQLRAPNWIYPAAGWQCDDAIGSTWGYTEGMTCRTEASILRELIELASQGGNLLLNISPKGDGSIPDVQQRVLLAVGNWLQQNGEAVYGSHPWVKMGEGPAIPDVAPGDWKGGSTAQSGPRIQRKRQPDLTEADFRFTTANGALYVFGFVSTSASIRIRSLASASAHVERVTMLGTSPTPLKFRQSADALELTLPATNMALPYVLKVEGSMQLGGTAGA
jgi:alpha-L-fucosidase